MLLAELSDVTELDGSSRESVEALSPGREATANGLYDKVDGSMCYVNSTVDRRCCKGEETAIASDDENRLVLIK